MRNLMPGAVRRRIRGLVSFGLSRLGMWVATAAYVVAGAAAPAAGQSAANNPADVVLSTAPMIHVLHPGDASAVDTSVPRTSTIEDRASEPGAPLAASAGLTIVAVFDSSIASDPNAVAIENAINTAIANVQSSFSDPITVTITFKKMTSGLGQSSTYFATGSYNTFLGGLKADARSTDDGAAVAHLPSVTTNPVNGLTTINVKTANWRAVGVTVNPPAGQSDGTISVNTTITSPGSPGSTGRFNLVPVVAHEIDEVLGLGSALPSPPAGTIFPQDLFRYSTVNTRTFTTANSLAYFSIDGSTALAQFDNQNDGGDFGDWQSSPLPTGVPPRVQDAFATPGSNPALSVELNALDVIGYDRRVSQGQRRTPADYDGDHKTDVTVYRPATGDWWVLKSSTNFATYDGYHWGLSTDIPVAGDYDGDGKADVAVYRPATGDWWVLKSSTNFTTYAGYHWGVSGDIPVPGDYDGDGKTDVAVYRPATGDWWVLKSSTNFATYDGYHWGLNTDVPVAGDYDGDGKTDVAVYRPSTGDWWVLKSSTNFATYDGYHWGLSTDIPVVGDYDGDGKTDAAVYRPATGDWWVLKSSTNFTTYDGYHWGLSTDIPVAGDYDGDGKTDAAVYRPATGDWWVLKSSTNFTAYDGYHWGLSTDIPVVEAR